MTEIALRNQQTGRVAMFDPAHADQLLLQGSRTGETYEPVSEADLAQVQQRAYANTMLGEAETFGRGAVDAVGNPIVGATAWAMGAEGPMPGMSSMIEGGIRELAGATPLEAGQAIGTSQQLSETLSAENPLARGAGEIVGSALPFAFGPGAALGEAAVARLGTTALTAGGRRLAGYAAQGAIEGAVDAAGRELVADPQASAQRILASAGMGALLGGTAGAALPAAGMAVGGAARKVGQGAQAAGRAGLDALHALRPKLASEVADAASETGTTSALRDMYVGAAAAAKNLDPKLVNDYVAGGQFSEVGEYSARNLGEIVDGESRKAAGELRSISRDVDDVLDEFRASPAKAEHIRANTPEDVLRDPRRIAVGSKIAKDTLSVAQSIRDEVGALKASGYTFSKAGMGEIENTLRMVEQMADAGVKVKDMADVFALGDRVKRALDRGIKPLRAAAREPRNGMNGWERDKFSEFADQLFEANNGLRASLESPQIYGEYGAGMQQRINATYAVKDQDGISGVDALNAFRDIVMQRRDTDFATGKPIYELDPAKLKSIFSGLGTQEKELAERDLRNYIDRAAQSMEAHAESGAYLGEAYTGKAKRAADGLRALGKQIDDLTDTHLHATNWGQLEGQGGAALGGALVTAGAFAGGPLGAALGGAAAAVFNPASVSSAINGAVSAYRRSGVSGESVRKWVASGAAKAKAAGRILSEGVTPAGKQAAKVTGQAVRAGMVSAAVRSYYGDDMTPAERRDRYRKRLQDLERWQPGRVAAAMNTDGTVPPQVAQAIAAKEAEVRAYLLERAPSAKYGGAVRPGIPYAPSEMEQEVFARQVGTALQPSTAVDDLQAGVATPEQMTVLQDLYPDYYQTVRLGAVQGLADADSDGIRIPLHQRAYLDALLRLDGAGDPALSAAFAATVSGELAAQEEQQAQSAQQPPPSGGGSLAATPAMSQFSMS